jgi:hypothetical protein
MDGGCDSGRSGAAPDGHRGVWDGADAPARELDAGQPGRAQSTAAAEAQCIGF